jgi:hypothetical protein
LACELQIVLSVASVRAQPETPPIALPVDGIDWVPWRQVRQRLLALPLVFSAFFVISLLTKRFGIILISGLCLLWIAVSAVKLVLQKRELLKSDFRRPVIESVPAQVLGGQHEGCVVPSRFAHFSSLSVPRKLKMKRAFRWRAILLPINCACLHGCYVFLTCSPSQSSGRPAVGRKNGAPHGGDLRRDSLGRIARTSP